MSSFFWNVRGLNKSTKHSVIKKWVKDQNFLFGCLIETRVKESLAQRLARKLFKDWSVLTNYEFNRRGRIWEVWRKDVRLTPVFQSEQMITCSVKIENQDEEFFCSFIYASNFAAERRLLWNDLRDHSDSPIISTKPWIIYGDFNEILDMEEHSSSDDHPAVTHGMRDFQEMVHHCSLVDMAFHGPLLTWCNKREHGLISKKLDRVLVNDMWTHTFSTSYSVFEAGGCSDHLRCRINMNIDDQEMVHEKKPFKFVNALTNLDEFKPLVQEYWQETEPVYLSTSTLFRFTKKLKALKPKIRMLAKDRMGNLVKKAKEAYDDLCKKQEANLANPSDTAMEEETVAYIRWEKVAILEEKYLKQRSKLHWLQVGDKNNKTFYRAIVMRESQNSIREIQRQDGSVTKKVAEIKEEAERFFREFLQMVPTDYEELSTNDLQELMPFRCSETDKEMLTSPVSAEEIKRVLFAMPTDKSPGPDGYTSEFYKSTWDILGSEFTLAVQSFFVKGFLPKGVNSTILALIPKKTEARVMKDYRPISCCNVIYKVISKIIANRLKQVLPKFVAGNQSAFVQDRLLIENVLLATELVKDYHKDTISSRCAIKIDISKAFDSVQWSFIRNVLSAIEFPSDFIHWIMLCITTASFSVQVNGELVGFFNSARGLRQGCSLSPYLFVVSMDVLSKLLDKAAGLKKFGFHPRCKNIGLTHLSFADDLMILSDGKVRSIEGIVEVFNTFARCSGLKISMEKSTVYLAGLARSSSQEIVEKFPFEVGNLPVRYLGLPLLTKKLTSTDYLPLLEHIKKKIGSWSSRFLSYAGRLNLIRSVLWSICNFWMGAYRLPRDCIRDIEKVCSAFLWSGGELKANKAKITWAYICTPKIEGGLGLKSLKEANHVSCLKLIWRLVSHADSLWVRWSETYLLKQVPFWAIKETTSLGSWMWKKILKSRDAAKMLCKVEIKNGTRTSFWFDDWCDMGRLIDIAGDRGVIDMGIKRNATVSEAWIDRRRRRHRVHYLNSMEDLLTEKWDSRKSEKDLVLWKAKKRYISGCLLNDRHLE